MKKRMTRKGRKCIKRIQMVAATGVMVTVLCNHIQIANGMSDVNQTNAATMLSEDVSTINMTAEEKAAAEKKAAEEKAAAEKKAAEEKAAAEKKAAEEKAAAEKKAAEEKAAAEAKAAEEQEDPSTATETPAEETPAEETPAEETPAEETPAEETPAEEVPAEEIPAEEEAPEEITGEESEEEIEDAGSSDDTIEDDSEEAVYVEKNYDPSEQFLTNSEKITYNIAVPIEGIPSFITQEMVIGALKCQDETGFPASVTIAQIIQESGFGLYGQGGESGQGLSYLAYQYCNLFGIKGTGPAGSVNMSTGEQTVSGDLYTTEAGFRVYHTYTECIEDRTQLLQRAYSDLTDGATDANTFAMNIGSRWATSLTYSQNLISQMERYDLYRLDKMKLSDFNAMIGIFANPCPGAVITSTFGYRTYDNSFHKGLDLGTGSENIPTYAADAGTVIVAGWSDTAGNWVVIDHGNGLVTKYMHHSAIYVEAGQHVEKGQQIGLSGTTGDSSGNHLHFQVEENGVAVDPEPYLWGAEDVQNVESTENAPIQTAVAKKTAKVAKITRVLALNRLALLNRIINL